MADTLFIISLQKSSDGRWEYDGVVMPFFFYHRDTKHHVSWIGAGGLALMFGTPRPDLEAGLRADMASIEEDLEGRGA